MTKLKNDLLIRALLRYWSAAIESVRLP